jgi:hypothetical protein
LRNIKSEHSINRLAFVPIRSGGFQRGVRVRRRRPGKDVFHRPVFSTLEIIFCIFLAENYFVKVRIPFIGVMY